MSLVHGGQERPIVIVDDAAEDRILVAHVLARCKLLNPVLSFGSGIEFVTYAKQMVDWLNSPVFVLLDLKMPELSGVQVLREIQAVRFAERVPVVMLSGVRDIKAIHEGYQLGAKTFFVKPVSEEDVVQLLSVLPIRVDHLSEGHIIRVAEPSRGDVPVTPDVVVRRAEGLSDDAFPI